jgi:hypothetical protein
MLPRVTRCNTPIQECLIRCRRGVDRHEVQTDRRAIVECLLSARYSESEIIDYLEGPLGLSEADAVIAVRDATGAGNTPSDSSAT